MLELRFFFFFFFSFLLWVGLGYCCCYRLIFTIRWISFPRSSVMIFYSVAKCFRFVLYVGGDVQNFKQVLYQNPGSCEKVITTLLYNPSFKVLFLYITFHFLTFMSFRSIVSTFQTCIQNLIETRFISLAVFI